MPDVDHQRHLVQVDLDRGDGIALGHVHRLAQQPHEVELTAAAGLAPAHRGGRDIGGDQLGRYRQRLAAGGLRRLQVGIARGDDGVDRGARPRGFDDGHQVGRGNQDLGAAIGQLVAQFMLARQRQAWHRDGTQLGGGQMRQDGLRTVLQEQGDTMPTRHAEPLELHGQPRRQLIEFAPADRAAVPQQGDALGVCAA